MVGGREMSASEIIEAALARLEPADAAVCAFTRYWPRRARQAAAAVDRAVARGEKLPLAGVPLAVKASQDPGSPLVRRLVASGAIPLAATAVPGPGTDWQTWGQTSRGPTVNPWRSARTTTPRWLRHSAPRTCS